MTPEAKPKPGATAKPVVIAQRSWSREPEHTVHLVEHRYSDTQWEVYLLDGSWIGTVGRYTGSLDRKAGRLRVPGKRRTLWSGRGTYRDARTFHGFVSRADAIRDLIDTHARRGAL